MFILLFFSEKVPALLNAINTWPKRGFPSLRHLKPDQIILPQHKVIYQFQNLSNQWRLWSPRSCLPSSAAGGAHTHANTHTPELSCTYTPLFSLQTTLPPSHLAETAECLPLSSTSRLGAILSIFSSACVLLAQRGCRACRPAALSPGEMEVGMSPATVH